MVAMNFRSWWVYAITERLGYRRPSPVTPDDERMRIEAEHETERLQLGLLVLKKRVEALTPKAPRQEW